MRTAERKKIDKRQNFSIPREKLKGHKNLLFVGLPNPVKEVINSINEIMHGFPWKRNMKVNYQLNYNSILAVDLKRSFEALILYYKGNLDKEILCIRTVNIRYLLQIK